MSTPTGTNRWQHVALLTGVEPVVLDTLGDFDQGEGMKVTLFPHHLLIEVAMPSGEGHLLIPVADILGALCHLTKAEGN